MNDFVALAIVGAAVSGLVQFLKTQTYVSPVLAVICLSVAGGVSYFFVRDTNVLANVVQVILYANTFYLFLIKPLQS